MNDDDFAELFKKLPKPSSSGTSWQDVMAEFEALGKTFGQVLRSAWTIDGDANLTRLRDTLQARIDELQQAVEGTPEAQQAREQVNSVADMIRSAMERASEEIRPELLNLLRQANAELRRVNHLDD
jgi:ElaB/YqjD/DUF883 family membrane-anchored ribosome-binding protein